MKHFFLVLVLGFTVASCGSESRERGYEGFQVLDNVLFRGGASTRKLFLEIRSNEKQTGLYVKGDRQLLCRLSEKQVAVANRIRDRVQKRGGAFAYLESTSVNTWKRYKEVILAFEQPEWAGGNRPDGWAGTLQPILIGQADKSCQLVLGVPTERD